MDIKLLISAFLIIASQHSLSSNLSDSEKAKIALLKSELGSSQCTFERNGKSYKAKKALKHITRKQAHFEDEIDSVAKFIELTATQSSISGKPYYIVCEGERICYLAD